MANFAMSEASILSFLPRLISNPLVITLPDTTHVIYKLMMQNAFTINCYTNIYPWFGYINTNKNFFHNLMFRILKMVKALTPLLALDRHSI
jgi:hypothetical protein